MLEQKELLADILKLSVPERIMLVEAVWDSISDDQSPALTDEQEAEIGRRLDAFERNPRAALTWSDILAQVGKGT
jgi:putative addiction module component (TIGR02574 family)